jgi:ribosomal protein L40E
MGRALRPAPDKARAIILDHSGNCLRHGLPTEEIEWTLESGGRRKKSDDGKTIGCRQCATCYAVSPLGSVTCRECGAAFEIKPREIETRDGELVEFAQVHADMAKAAKQREIQTARTREDLERIARQRGYAPGWVNYILAARQKNKARGPIDPYAKISAWKGER